MKTTNSNDNNLANDPNAKDTISTSAANITGGTMPPITPPTKIATPAPDPFDLSRLRLSQDFSAALGVKKKLMTVPVKKPAGEWFIRTHPDAAYRIETMVLELKEDKELYLVAQNLWPELSSESTLKAKALFTAINTQGVVFLWPIRLPAPDGRVDDWSRSALEAAMLAADSWVRVQSNMGLGAYEVTTSSLAKQPVWPEMPFQELVNIAFKGRMIESFDHPVLRRLRGEI